MPQVVITIKPDGKAEIDAVGYTGPSCSLVTKPYQQALGREVAETVKPEMFQEQKQQQEQKQ